MLLLLLAPSGRSYPRPHGWSSTTSEASSDPFEDGHSAIVDLTALCAPPVDAGSSTDVPLLRVPDAELPLRSC